MRKLFPIKEPRQKRALKALLTHNAVSVKDMGIIAGALNPRQIISELRGKYGLRDAIKTRRVKVIDRDGKTCRPGEYFVLQEDKALLEDLLKEATPSSKSDEMAKVPLNTNIMDGGQL